MSIRVTNLPVGLDQPDSDLPAELGRVLGVSAEGLEWRILRKSLDTRDKDNIHFVYSAEVRYPGDEQQLVAKARARAKAARIELRDDERFIMPAPGDASLHSRPVVIGSGPGGLAAAYFLAEQGYHPLVLERGRRVTERIHDVKTFDAGGQFDPASNYLFGEGGAGTFSDGKLTCRSTGPDVLRILELFAECKGKPSILYEHRPHLGSNRLPAVVKALRQRIERLGGEVKFDCQVEDFDIRDGELHGLFASSGFVATNVAVLAVGHSARDMYETLNRRGVPLEQKPFQMGLRIEHPQALVNRVQFGPRPLEDKLGNADYTLVVNGPHDVFTFCMCAGGYIIPSVSHPGYFCTNGMSLSRRDSYYANSGLMITVPVTEFGGTDVMAGVRLQERYERRAFELGGAEYRCPVQFASDFVADRPTKAAPACSYPRQTVATRLDEVIPPVIAAALRHALPAMDRRWRGKYIKDAVLAGPESRGSSPVRVVRGSESRESPGVVGLYPVGEGAGYAGGIVSAAVDGLRSAKAIIARFARP